VLRALLGCVAKALPWTVEGSGARRAATITSWRLAVSDFNFRPTRKVRKSLPSVDAVGSWLAKSRYLMAARMRPWRVAPCQISWKLKMKPALIVVALSVVLTADAAPAKLDHVYIDDTQNVHVVTASGTDLRVTRGGHRARAALSPDGETAVWLVEQTWIAVGAAEPGASELVIYRHGRVRSVRCEPFIRDYWFWKNGSRIAIDCGGAHFAGQEILYDSRTLRKLDSFDQAATPEDKRPAWSTSSDKYEADH
jgi:hypothetical protein